MTEEINKTIAVLKNDGLILYPTDTCWALGCDATNSQAVGKIYQLTGKHPGEGLVCLVANDFMLEKQVEKVPDLAYEIMDISDKPVTIVYEGPKTVAKNVLAKDGTVAIRVTRDKFCKYLINKWGKPIVATTAAILGKPAPKGFHQINDAILKGVDYVVHLNRDSTCTALSSIIQLSNNGNVKVIRE